jgi:hypothetical protein
MLNRKPLGDNIYKQWKLLGGGITVIRLNREIWVIAKGGTKKREQEMLHVSGRRGMLVAGFVSLVCVGCISVIVVKGNCVRDCRGLGLCTVGTVG